MRSMERQQGHRAPLRRRCRSWALGAVTAAVAMLGLVGCAENSSSQGSKSDKPETAVVERTVLEVTIDELGVVEPTRTANLISPFSGRIVKILESGTHVKKGDTVAVLDTKDLSESLDEEVEKLRGIKKDLEASVESLEMELRSNVLDLSSALTQLDLARVRLANVNRNLSDLEYLRSENIVAQDQVRDAASGVTSTQLSTFREDMNFRSQVTGSQSSEKSNQINLQRNELRGRERLNIIKEKQERIEQADIKAPVDGLFLRHKRWNWQSRRNVERQTGEEVEEGDRIGSVPDLESLVVRAQIPESDVKRVSRGTDVKLVFEALGNAETAGVVRIIGPIAIDRETSPGGQVMASGSELTGEKVFELTIEMLSTDSRLKPGLTCRTRVVLDRRENVLSVPIESITTRDAKHSVHVQKGKRYEQREVTIGQSNGQRVEILEGLKEGEVVYLGTPPAGAGST